MRAHLLIAFLPLSLCIVKEDTVKKMKEIAMSPKELRKVEQLHYGWYIQATSALLGAMGKDLYRRMNRNNRKAFVACLDSIEEEHNVKMGAECLVKAFDKTLLKAFPHVVYSPQYDFVGKDLPPSRSENKKKKLKAKMTAVAKKKAAKVLNFNNLSKSDEKKTRKKKKSARTSSATQPLRISRLRQTRVRRYKRNILSLYSNKEAIEEAKTAERSDRPFLIRNRDRAPDLHIQPKPSPVKFVTNLMGEVVRTIRNQTKEEHTTLRRSYKQLKRLQDEVTTHNRESRFKHRMLDAVLGKNHPFRKPKSFSERFRDVMPDKMVDKNIYGLVDVVEKHTKDINYNFLSPRFLPLLPDKYAGSKKLLSPNLFPLYKDDSGDSIMPLPDVLEKSGMNEKDRDSVLELVMDASGVNTAVEDALRLVNVMKSSGFDKDIVGVTEIIDQVFGEIASSLTGLQKKEMKNRKYSFLTKEQMNKLYGPKGVYNISESDIPFDFEEFGALSSKQKDESLRGTVRLLAKGQHLRSKRYTINHFAHISLSPFAFAPTINTLNVLGPITLSPSLFSPSIISPLLLSPPIISPQVGNPLIFSPYVLGPNTISAAVFNAYVFSPYVLSPNVINPYVLSPLILSPFVLCPDVVSPTVLSGVVLSPSILSPSVFTESALAINVLSPTFLS